MAVKFIRYAFALGSWFLALGLLVLLVRSDSGGQAGAFAMLAAVLVANGFLVIRRT